MKSFLIFLLQVAAVSPLYAQSVGIGTLTPNASAQLEVASTTKGILIPRMTTAQRTAIVNPAQGLLVFQTDGSAGFYVNRSSIPSSPNWSQVTEGSNFWLTANSGPTDIFNTNSGNTGVGINTPLMKLHVSNTDSSVALFDNSQALATDIQSSIYFHNGYFIGGYYTGSIRTIGTSTTAARIGIFTGASTNANSLQERVSLDNTGNFGIGTIAPQVRLHVLATDTGMLRLENTTVLATGVSNAIYFKTGSWFTGGIKQTGTGSNVSRTGFFGFASGNPSGLKEYLSITDAGNVGVGTITPSEKLSVQTTTNSLGISHSDGSIKVGTFVGGVGVGGYFGTISNHPLYFMTNNGAAQFTILQSGNVGIGTTSPAEKLTVQSTPNSFGISHTDGNVKLGTYLEGTGAFASGYFGTISNHPLHFMTNGTSQVTVLQSGNVGIGITSPTEKLEIQTGSNNYGISHTDGTIKIGTFVGGAAVGGYLGTISNHPLYFMTNSGAAQVTVLQSGNVGIGITSPTEKLEVKTGSNSYGFSHTDGTIKMGTFVGGAAVGGYLGTISNHPLYFMTNNGAAQVALLTDGRFCIGTTAPATGYLLNVNGKIIAEEVRVQLKASWPDFVFAESYKHLSIQELEKYIYSNKHLPNIPSAGEVQTNGQFLGDMQRKMMEKIEELTLYIIDQNKRIEKLESLNNCLKDIPSINQKKDVDPIQ